MVPLLSVIFSNFNLVHNITVFLYQFNRPAARRRRRYRDEQKLKPELSPSNNRNNLTTRKGQRVNHTESNASFGSIPNNSDDIPSIEIPDSIKNPPTSTTRVHLIEKTSESVKSSIPQRKLAERARSVEKPSKPQRSAVSVHRLNKVSSTETSEPVDVTKSLTNFHLSNQTNPFPDPPLSAKDQSTTNSGKSSASSPKEQPAPLSAVTVRRLNKLSPADTSEQVDAKKSSSETDPPRSAAASAVTVHRLNKAPSAGASNNFSSSSQINANNNKSTAEVPKEPPTVFNAVVVRKIKKIKRKKSQTKHDLETDGH